MEHSQDTLKALIALLDDPDQNIYQDVKGRIISFGPNAVPMLENAWENCFDPLQQDRIENIIHYIQYSSTHTALCEWRDTTDQDLLTGAYIVARYQYPELKKEDLQKQIDALAQDIWLELNEKLTPLEKVKVINHVLYTIHGYSGNATNFHAPENSFINLVMQNKKGNPLSLAIIYILAARQCNVPIYGINLPEHFILGFKNTLDTFSFLKENEILFYINSFNKGSIFSRKEIELFLKQLKLQPNDYYFNPCSNQDIIKRLLNNLVLAYEKLGYTSKLKELKSLFDAL